MNFEMIVSKTIARIKANYGICLQESDFGYCPDKRIYITSQQTAKFFRVSYHYFTNKYVKPLVASGVGRIMLGSTKYYDLEHIENRLKKLRDHKNIFAVCAEMVKINKKKKKA